MWKRARERVMWPREKKDRETNNFAETSSVRPCALTKKYKRCARQSDDDDDVGRGDLQNLDYFVSSKTHQGIRPWARAV